MKIKLMGRAGQVTHRGTTVVLAMESQKIPVLPEGLPEWPDTPVTYTVYLAEKQWHKVMADHPTNELIIIEGLGFYDTELKCISILAHNLKIKPPDRPRPQERGYKPVSSISRIRYP